MPSDIYIITLSTWNDYSINPKSDPAIFPCGTGAYQDPTLCVYPNNQQQEMIFIWKWTRTLWGKVNNITQVTIISLLQQQIKNRNQSQRLEKLIDIEEQR